MCTNGGVSCDSIIMTERVYDSLTLRHCRSKVVALVPELTKLSGLLRCLNIVEVVVCWEAGGV